MNAEAKSWLIALVWAALAFVVCAWRGPAFVRNLRPPRDDHGRPLILDFFQDWSSARNRLEGLPIYTSQEETARRYVGFQFEGDPSQVEFIQFNAHPPTSVLLALPLARLDYPDAFLAWGLLSLAGLGVSIALMARQLPGALPWWSVFPLVVLLLFCNPFRQQMNQGQLNLVLLPLLTGAWAADRSGRPGWASALLGAATAIKLFPGFLFLYFVVRRQWRPLVTGAAGFLALTGLTVAVLGLDCYRDYFTVALPSLEKYRTYWPNVSLAGFWHKLFNVTSGRVLPLGHNPALAWSATLVCDGVVVGLAAWSAWWAGSRRQQDLSFALTLTAMLLVSPITWDHYFTLLFLTLFLLWAWRPRSLAFQAAFWVLLLALWMPPLLYWQMFIPGVSMSNWAALVATPSQALTALSMQTYALVGLFALVVVVRQRYRPEPTLPERGREELVHSPLSILSLSGERRD